MELASLIAATILGPTIAAVVAYNAYATYVIVRRRFRALAGGAATPMGVAASRRDECESCPCTLCEDDCAQGCGC